MTLRELTGYTWKSRRVTCSLPWTMLHRTQVLMTSHPLVLFYTYTFTFYVQQNLSFIAIGLDFHYHIGVLNGWWRFTPKQNDDMKNCDIIMICARIWQFHTFIKSSLLPMIWTGRIITICRGRYVRHIPLLLLKLLQSRRRCILRGNVSHLLVIEV